MNLRATSARRMWLCQVSFILLLNHAWKTVEILMGARTGTMPPIEYEAKALPALVNAAHKISPANSTSIFA